jgi:ribosomal protein L7/L12
MIKLDDPTLTKVRTVLKNQDKVTVMKIVINATGCGLAEAKTYVDKVLTEL